MPDATKRCPRCGLVKPRTEFAPRKDRGPGVVASRCRPCDAALGRRRYWFGGGREQKRDYYRRRKGRAA